MHSLLVQTEQSYSYYLIIPLQCYIERTRYLTENIFKKIVTRHYLQLLHRPRNLKKICDFVELFSNQCMLQSIISRFSVGPIIKVAHYEQQVTMGTIILF